ncbi:MAG: GC-type dockerin domain-anchored protein [Phycisphaerales bacterium JB064]
MGTLNLSLSTSVSAYVSAVAGVALASSVAMAQSITAFGLPHDALGQAVLRPTNDGLLVSNLGSSGQDGVRVGLGQAGFHVVTFEPPPLTSLPDGAFLETTAFGEVDGQPGSPVWSVRSTASGGSSFVSVDASRLRPDALRLEARLDGQVVSRVRITDIDPDLRIVEIPRLEGCIIDPVWQMEPDIWAIIGFPEPAVLTLLGGELVRADQIVIATEGLRVDIGAITATEMRSADYREITLVDEALGKFDFEHRALGQTRLRASEGALTIAGIGSSGMDGVEMRWLEATGPTSGFSAELEPLRLVGPEQTLTLRATGRVPGAPEVDLGVSSINNGVVTADFSPLGAQTATLIGLLDGRIVDRREVPARGEIIVMDEIVVHGCAKQPSLPLPPFPPFPCFIWRFDETLISPIIGDPYIADEVRILASDATVAFDGLESFSIMGQGIEQFSLIGESLVVDCRADCDGDGTLDFLDFLCFLNQFDAGDPAADCDGDGVLDFLDFLCFLNAFDAGCP